MLVSRELWCAAPSTAPSAEQRSLCLPHAHCIGSPFAAKHVHAPSTVCRSYLAGVCERVEHAYPLFHARGCPFLGHSDARNGQREGHSFFFKVLPHWVILENLDLPPLYQNVMIRSEYAGVRKNTPSPNF